MTRRQRKYVDFVVVFNVAAALSRSTSPRGYGFGSVAQQQLGRHREMGGREKNAISVDYYVKRSNVSTASRPSLASLSDKSLQAQSIEQNREAVRPASSALTLALRDIELLYSPHRNTTLVEGAAAAAVLRYVSCCCFSKRLWLCCCHEEQRGHTQVRSLARAEERTCGGGQQKDSEDEHHFLGT